MILAYISLVLRLWSLQGGTIYDSFHTPPLPYGQMVFADPNHGWLVSTWSLHATADGGQSWHGIVPCEEGASPVAGLPPGLVISVAWHDASRVIVRTALSVALLDRAGRCSILKLPVKSMLVTDIRFLDERIGWVTAQNDGVYRTTDGGQTWTRAAMKEVPAGLVPVSASEVWGTNGGTLMHTKDGGASWETVLSAGSGGVSRVCITHDGIGWWLGIGFLYKTTDAGVSWHKLPWKTDGDVSFDETGMEGWIVGEGGRVLHSLDAGETWEYLKAPTKRDLAQVQAFSDGRAWICADERVFLRTLDHGRTWELTVVR